MSDEPRCFRCRAKPKILIHMKIDDKVIQLCPRCFYEHSLFLDGCVINEMVHIGRSSYLKEEEE